MIVKKLYTVYEIFCSYFKESNANYVEITRTYKKFGDLLLTMGPQCNCMTI